MLQFIEKFRSAAKAMRLKKKLTKKKNTQLHVNVTCILGLSPIYCCRIAT